MSYPPGSVTSGNSSKYPNADSLHPMRELAERQRALRPVMPNGPNNSNNLVGRDVQRLPANADGEAPSEKEDGSGGDVALALGAAALVTTAATYFYDWWSSDASPAAAPVTQPPAAPSDNEAPPVNMFLPRDADDADLAAIRLAELTARDAEIAQRLADEDARAAADAKKRREAQETENQRIAQKLHDLAIKK